MAAAEYFTGQRPSAPYLAARPQPQQRVSNSYIPQNYANTPPFPSPQPQTTTPPLHPPPPYGDEPKPHIQFPAELPGRHSFSGQRPNPQQWQQPYPTPNPYPTQLQPYKPQNLHPYYKQEPSLSGYSSDPERHHHRKHRDRECKRRTSEAATPRSRSTNADGFIGAAGGGLIGDLIFPGLGTAAGAIAGWIGGKDYGKHRKEKEQRRERDQEKWEDRWGSRDHSHSPRRRSRDHSRDERRSNDDGGGRRSYDERRKSEH